MNRNDLPTNPAEALAEVDRRITELGRQEQQLVLLRGELVRELVGTGRGGKQRAAETLGVSWTQIQRGLGEDIVRRVRAALAGWDRHDYAVRAVGDHAAVALGVDVAGRSAATSLNAAYSLLNALHDAGLEGSDTHGRTADEGEAGPGRVLASGGEITVTIA